MQFYYYPNYYIYNYTNNLLLFNDPFMTLENHHRGLIQSSLWLYLGKLGCNVSIHFILWTIIHHYLHRFFIPLHSTKTFEVLLFVYVWDNLWYCFPYASSGHPCSETQHFSMAILLQQASQSHGSLICRDEFTKVNLFLLVGPACSAGELFTLKH